MKLHRRRFLVQAGTAVVIGGLLPAAQSQDSVLSNRDLPVIIDTHQHLWDLTKLRLPWLSDAPAVLQRSYTPEDYEAATQGLQVKTIYMEVDVDTADHDNEAAYVTSLCQSTTSLTRAAVIGGRPASDTFGAYLDRQSASGKVRGVRQVLHVPSTPSGYCLQENFVRGVQLLGARDLSFDLCMRPGDLKEGIRLTELCPDTKFVLDHCGNADVKAFHPDLRGDKPVSHDVDTWKRDIESFSKRPNVICKISGIVASAPAGWKTEHLAPIVRHCLDAFGADRVVFGGDWPVCLLGSPLRGWIDALRTIVADRPEAEQRKLWSENAAKFYRLA